MGTVPVYRGDRIWDMALIDDADVDRTTPHTWRLSNGYAVTYIAGHRTTLHSHILGKRDGMVIDHINGNKMDCTRQNLRHVTQQVNAKNRVESRQRVDDLVAWLTAPDLLKSIMSHDVTPGGRWVPHRTHIVAHMAAWMAWKGAPHRTGGLRMARHSVLNVSL